MKHFQKSLNRWLATGILLWKPFKNIDRYIMELDRDCSGIGGHIMHTSPIYGNYFNLLSSGRYASNFQCVNLQYILVIHILSISNKIALRRIPQDITEDKSRLAQY